MEQREAIETGTRKQAAKIAHLRQLCTLGLGGQVIMPTLLRTLAEIVPYDRGAFCWADGRGLICNPCEEHPDAQRAFPAALVPLDGLPAWPVQAQSRDRQLRLPVGRGAQPAGTLILARDVTKRPFSSREQDMLSRMAEYLHKGVLARRNQRGSFVASGETGLVVLDEGGAVRLASSCGRQLFLQAACPYFAPAKGATTTSAIEDLGVRLAHAFSGAPQQAVRQQNDWGVFEFRPHPLAYGNGRAAGLAVCISRHEPLALRLMRGMRNLGLSSRQKEVVLLLAFGYSQRAMASRMGVSYHTVVDHLRKIFRKLGVRDTHQLLAAVMGSG